MHTQNPFLFLTVVILVNVLIAINLTSFSILKFISAFIYKSFGLKKMSLLSNQNNINVFEKKILDPHEIKILKSMLFRENNLSLDINEFNVLLNLNKLSHENQRQRRHIVIKELNIKLYPIFGQRETIIRTPSEFDKRIKHYQINPEIKINDIDFFVNRYDLK